MDYIAIIPPLVLSIAIACAYFLYRDYLRDLFQGLVNLKVFTPDEVLEKRERVPPLPSYTIELTPPMVREGVDALSSYVKELNPDWIVGVHLGGRLLSVCVADRIGFPPAKCLFIPHSPDRTAILSFRSSVLI